MSELDPNSMSLIFSVNEDGDMSISTAHRFSEDISEEVFMNSLFLLRGIIVAVEVDPGYLLRLAHASQVGVQLEAREAEIDEEIALEDLPDGENIAKVNFKGRMN